MAEIINLTERRKNKEPVWGKSILDENEEYIAAQEEIIRLTRKFLCNPK